MYLSLKDLAARWKVSITTVWRIRKRDGFPKPTTTFGPPRFAVSDIEKFEQQHRPAAVPAGNNNEVSTHE